MLAGKFCVFTLALLGISLLTLKNYQQPETSENQSALLRPCIVKSVVPFNASRNFRIKQNRYSVKRMHLSLGDAEENPKPEKVRVDRSIICYTNSK